MANSILYNGGTALSYSATQIANNPLIGLNAAAFSGTNVQIIERTVNVADLLTTTANGVAITTASGDTLDLFPIPPRSLVLWVGLEVIKADTNATATVALADVVPNAWVAATAMSAANVTTGIFTGVVTPKFYVATTPTDRLRATIGTAALTNSIFRAIMVIVPISRSDNNRATTVPQ